MTNAIQYQIEYLARSVIKTPDDFTMKFCRENLSANAEYSYTATVEEVGKFKTTKIIVEITETDENGW